MKNCRTGHLDPEVPEGDTREPADILKEILKTDPYIPRLKPVTQDESVDGLKYSWTVKLAGPQHRQAVLGKKSLPSSEHFGVVVLKSLRWPGAVTCWKGVSQY